jgi:hypothetical protein
MNTHPLVKLQPNLFRAYFNQKPFYVAHSLEGHPLFALERLVELACRLPPEFVEYNAGRLAVGQDPRLTPRTGLSVPETIRRIESAGSWMVLKRVEQDPAYAELLAACLDPIAAHAEARVGRTFDRQGFIFISSPGAVTPFHLDPEHNFLLQVRGSKTVNMWDPRDRYVVSERDLEQFHSDFQYRNLPYREAFQHTAHVLQLEPGQGLHFPVTVPHWVQNGAAVSISFSITFRSDWSRRQELLYRANATLRRRGVLPTPVGASPLRDRAKIVVATVVDGVRQRLRA